MGSSGSATGRSQHPIALPRLLQHPRNRGKPCTEVPPKETAPLKTHSVLVKPLEWTQRGHYTEEIAGGVKDLIELRGCRPVGSGWGGAGRRDASGKQIIPPQDGYQHLQMLRLPSPSFPAAARHLENIKWSKPGREKGELSFAWLTLEFWSSQSCFAPLFSTREAPAGCFRAGVVGRTKVIIACTDEIQKWLQRRRKARFATSAANPFVSQAWCSLSPCPSQENISKLLFYCWFLSQEREGFLSVLPQFTHLNATPPVKKENSFPGEALV